VPARLQGGGHAQRRGGLPHLLRRLEAFLPADAATASILANLGRDTVRAR
jgi:hypothetical protein